MINNRRAGRSITGIMIGNARLSFLLASLTLAFCTSGTVAAAEDKLPPPGTQPASTRQPVRMVDFSTCDKPVYPRDDLQAGHTGMVDLRFLLNREGVVLDSTVIRSSGYDSLDEAVRQAFLKCRFNVVPESGPAEQWQRIQYIWQLED